LDLRGTRKQGCEKDFITRRNALFSPTNIIRMIKSRRMRWAGHVARTGRGAVHTGLRWKNLRKGENLEDSGVDGRIILRWIFEKWIGGGGHGLDQSASGQEKVVGFCECGNEPSVSIKCREFLD
jgi:hypothetical protein